MVAQSLPGIRRISVIPCASLPRHLMLTAICGGAVSLFRESLHDIPFCGSPVYKREGTILNNSRAEKSTLEFRSDVRIPDGVPVAFVVECVGGAVWLIGAREPNYPVIEFSDTSGSTSGDPAVRTYKITHRDIKSGIPAVL